MNGVFQLTDVLQVPVDEDIVQFLTILMAIGISAFKTIAQFREGRKTLLEQAEGIRHLL